MKKNILIMFMVCAIIISFAYAKSTKNKNSALTGSNILITADHLEKVEGYTKIHSDKNRDVAYYIKDSLSLTKMQMQEVSIEGLKDCKIISSTDGAFQVTTSTPENIVNGMSGRRVFNSKKQPIGFVDAMSAGGVLECRTLE